jgi:truncated hemoglobin YjbI
VLAACLLLGWAGRASAADEKKASGPLETKQLDTMLYNNLKDVIDRGAALYNSGDWSGCYRLWEGALLAVRPLLAHRAPLQQSIITHLAAAERNPYMNQRAFVLREVLDQIRTEVNPNPRRASGTDRARLPGPTDVTESGSRTVWQRLGGEGGVRKIVDDLVARAGKDRKVDFTRGGKYKVDVKELKQQLVDQISARTGGPYKYEGKSMREEHRGMHITAAEFDAFLDDFRAALRDNNVDPEDARRLISLYEGYRKDIVEGGGGSENKVDTTKPEKKTGGERRTGTTTVAGKVTSAGKAVYDGTVTFYGKDGGTAYKTPLGQDGSYRIEGIKPGEYQVTVRTTGEAAAPLVAKKYGDVKTTPLKVRIEEGANRNVDFQVEK